MIKSLRMKNFKCFESETIHCKALTLLSGLNGVGKSSVLQALLLLRQSYQKGSINNLVLNADLTHLGTAKDILYEFAANEQIGFELSLDNNKSGSWDFRYDKQADVLKLKENNSNTKIDKSVFQLSLFKNEFQYLQAERLGPRSSFEISDFRVRQKQQLGTKGEYTAHFLSIFGKELEVSSDLKHKKATSSKLRDQVEAWMSEISPGVRIHLQEYADMDLIDLRYSFKQGKVSSKGYRSTHVGFGITYTLPIITAILSAKPCSLLLLENPEA